MPRLRALQLVSTGSGRESAVIAAEGDSRRFATAKLIRTSGRFKGFVAEVGIGTDDQ